MKHLMQKRFIVIADYPDSPHIVGDLILVNKEGMHVAYGDNGMYLTDVAAYPHIFRELSWWECREESEMPKYVKHRDKIYKVTGWRGDYPYCEGGTHPFAPEVVTPATESEYNEYIKTTTNER